MTNYKEFKKINSNYNNAIENNEVETKNEYDPFNKIDKNQKAEYDMWGWIYQEIANLRLECSKLGVLVRLNNLNSPLYLETYHSHLYSLMIPISVLIPPFQWNIMEKKWLNLKIRIDTFQVRKNNSSSIKIPFTLIRDLDKLHRIALLIAQQKGLGIRITGSMNIDKAVENAIIGT